VGVADGCVSGRCWRLRDRVTKLNRGGGTPQLPCGATVSTHVSFSTRSLPFAGSTFAGFGSVWRLPRILSITGREHFAVCVPSLHFFCPAINFLLLLLVTSLPYRIPSHLHLPRHSGRSCASSCYVPFPFCRLPRLLAVTCPCWANRLPCVYFTFFLAFTCTLLLEPFEQLLPRHSRVHLFRATGLRFANMLRTTYGS